MLQSNCSVHSIFNTSHKSFCLYIFSSQKATMVKILQHLKTAKHLKTEKRRTVLRLLNIYCILEISRSQDKTITHFHIHIFHSLALTFISWQWISITVSCLLKRQSTDWEMGENDNLTVSPAAGLSNFESIREATNPYEYAFIVTVKLHLYVGRTDKQFSAFCSRRTLF